MKTEPKKIAVLGSTGSIGTQALDVIRANPEVFVAEVLTANSNSALLIKQALEFNPNAVVIADESKYNEVKNALASTDVKVFTGTKSIAGMVEMESVDLVLAAIVGFAGLESTLAAVRAKKNIALANKETLVVAGSLITKEARENAVNIYPVDSEHSAIFQCLAGEWQNKIEKIILTASGGPFRGMNADALKRVTKADALKHPNWKMGDKITIDSATMMNKGLEVIEAKWLFALKPAQIEIVVHPQSVVHSMVQFTDGSIKAQMGLPDMKLPIQYAFSFPDRIISNFPRFDFEKYPSLEFVKADVASFPCISLAYEALNKGGNMPCVLNAANEIAVSLFLREKISFTQIPALIEKSMGAAGFIPSPGFEDLFQTDREVRKKCLELV